jgi:hypothetical protein
LYEIWHVSHQLLRDVEEHLPDVLLLAAGEVLPQLMGGNPVVALVRRRRSGGLDWHRC